MTIGKKIFSSIFVIIILVIAFWIVGGIYIVVDSKFRSGSVNKFGKDGFLLKTHEGTLLMGGGEGMMANGRETFSFSVADDKMIAALEAVDSRKTVKLWYDKTLFSLPWRGNTNYFITKLEVMPDIYMPQQQMPQPQMPQQQIPQQTQQLPKQP